MRPRDHHARKALKPVWSHWKARSRVRFGSSEAERFASARRTVGGGYTPALGKAVAFVAPFTLASAALSAILLSIPDSQLATIWIGLGPLLYALVLAATAYLLVMMRADLLWTPVPWFLAACAAYFGFGPTLYSFANPATVSYADAFYAVSPSDLGVSCRST